MIKRAQEIGKATCHQHNPVHHLLPNPDHPYFASHRLSVHVTLQTVIFSNKSHNLSQAQVTFNSTTG